MAVLMRAATYATLFTAFVLVFLPAQVLERAGATPPASFGAAQTAGIATVLVGGAVALWCVLAFALIGRGTPAPFDPPRRLVVRGPYRYVRNPMYLGAGVALAGAAAYYSSFALLAFTATFLLVAHLFVVGYEERALRRRFGADYDDYRRRVRRWLPRPGRGCRVDGPGRRKGPRLLAIPLILVAGLADTAVASAQRGPALDVEVDGAMAPVTARIVLVCPDADGTPATHLLGFGPRGEWEIVRDSLLSISRTFTTSTEVRGACRDARGRTAPAPGRTIIAVNAARERDEVIALANAERERNGLAPLARDTGLDAVAEAHARDMAERGYFSHVTPEGRDLAARLAAARQAYRMAAENIAGNETPQLAMRAWLASPGHRENLLSRDYERTGVGVYRTPASPYTYYVEVFAK